MAKKKKLCISFLLDILNSLKKYIKIKIIYSLPDLILKPGQNFQKVQKEKKATTFLQLPIGKQRINQESICLSSW